MSYAYTIENASGTCREIDAEEFASLEMTCEFQGAMDLPDGVEFAKAITEEGTAVKVYREAS